MGKIIHELKKVSGRLLFPILISTKKPFKESHLPLFSPASGKSEIPCPTPLMGGGAEKVLIFKDNSIGDFLLFSGILKFYIKHFGDRAYCLVNSSVEEAAKLYMDNVIVMDNRKYFASFKYRYRLLNQLKDIGFGTAINSILNSSESRDILYILKIHLTYLYGGVVMELKRQRRWKDIANIIPALKMFDNSGMYTKILSHEKYFMERILNVEVADKDVKPYIPLKDTLSEGIINKFSLQKGRYIVFSFSSASLKKNYPANKFMEVIKYLNRRLNMDAVLIGHDQYDSVELSDFVIDLRGRTSLIDAFSIIKHARFFIGNETGTTHASWIMGVPTVMIYGGGHFGGFMPQYNSGHMVYKYMDCYYCNWGCKYTDIPVRCIGEITVEDIIKVAEKVLS
ncbi:MAG: glycosyltransferase family 9 protein [Nitrospinota bacterium]